MKQNKIKSIEEAGKLRGRRVILRLDLNVPIKGGEVDDDFRIRSAAPTLKYLSENGAKTLIISHIESGEKTLEPVCKVLAEALDIKFAPDLASAATLMKSVPEGGFILTENIRREAGEITNENSLAKRIAFLGDIYVNDAFSVSHRAHASVVSVPKHLPSYAGFLFMEEVKNLAVALLPEKPALLILGGAKLETKLPLLKKFVGFYDSVFVGGALANELLSIRHGGRDHHGLHEIVSNKNLYLPHDVWLRGARHAVSVEHTTKFADAVDCGAHTNDLLKELVNKSKFVLWNGMLGICEEGYTRGTHSLINTLAKSSAKVIVGGGDTVSEIVKMGMLSKFEFVSTGGGAMLDFLANGTLPGIDVLVSSK